MPIELWQGLLIPFAGTTLGAACVFFMRNNLSELVQRALRKALQYRDYSVCSRFYPYDDAGCGAGCLSE